MLNRSLFVAVFSLLAAVGTGRSQDIRGTVSGKVTDSSGLTLPGVTIEVHKNCKCSDCKTDDCRCCPAAFTIVTDANGNYHFDALNGAYELRANLSGYETRTVTVTVGAGQQVTANISLSKGDNETS